MKNCKKCLRFNGVICSAFSTLIKENCPSRITNPQDYVQELEDMMAYNLKNSTSKNQFYNLKKTRDRVCKRYGVEPTLITQKLTDHQLIGLAEAYLEDRRRGERGGQSEGDPNSEASLKQKMKDNRPVECKQNKQQRQEYMEALGEWEEENGKLEKLSRSPLTRNKVDSYTGDVIE